MSVELPRSLAGVPGPYIIGATGGSGTRVVARIVRRAGLFVGTHLNVSDDSLFLGDYSDRWIDRFMVTDGRSSDVAHAMVEDLDVTVAQHVAALLADGPDGGWRAWGWKEPRSIFLLPFFHRHFPGMKFLHVIRDGRDMAYSRNQNQLRKHGHTLLTEEESSRERPARSVALWARLNSQRADYGETLLGERYLRIRFEDLCRAAHPTVERILRFLGVPGDAAEIARLEVTPPASLERWREQDPSELAALTDIAGPALARFGYLAGGGGEAPESQRAGAEGSGS